MTKEEEKVLDNALDKILDQLDDNTKNTLIKLLMTHDRKDIWIQSMPIYVCQLSAMEDYMAILKSRAEQEGIKLDGN